MILRIRKYTKKSDLLCNIVSKKGDLYTLIVCDCQLATSFRAKGRGFCVAQPPTFVHPPEILRFAQDDTVV